MNFGDALVNLATAPLRIGLAATQVSLEVANEVIEVAKRATGEVPGVIGGSTAMVHMLGLDETVARAQRIAKLADGLLAEDAPLTQAMSPGGPVDRLLRPGGLLDRMTAPGGVLDRLTEQNYKVRGVNFGWKPKNSQAHLNKRAEMWCAMAEWIKTASLPLDKALKNDLTGVKVKPTSTGVIQLEGKKEMKARGLASPDAADAVAVTFAFPIARREYSSAEPPQRVYADNRGSSFSNTGWMGH